MATAAELQPVKANVAQLGAVSVITYYTTGPKGLDLVAVAQLGEAEAAVPLRFTATLAPDQRVAISVPQALGQPALAVEFTRIGDRIEVTQTPGPAVTQTGPAVARVTR
jgi:hypothetical protein